MLLHTFSNMDTYKVAVLIKTASFNVEEIRAAYMGYLQAAGIDPTELVLVGLPYTKGKAPAKYVAQQLDDILPELDSLGVKYLYCADAAYFKVLTNSRKAEPHLGYLMQTEYGDFTKFSTILGVNHKSLFYNPANETKLTLSLDTLISAYKGQYTELGAGIIHNGHYPESYEDIKAFLDSLHQYPYLACDVEAFSLRHEKAGIGTITFCWDHHSGGAFACDYLPYPEDEVVDGVYGAYAPNPKIRALLKEFFQNYKGRLRAHNCTYDFKVLIYNLWMDGPWDNEGLLQGLSCLMSDFDDTKVIAYLSTNSAAGNSLSLKDLAHEFAGNWANSDIKDIRRIPLPTLLQYNLIDGLATNYTYDLHYPVVVENQQEELYNTLMLESQVTITQIELTGMPLNPDNVAIAREELQKIVTGALEKLNQSGTGSKPSIMERFTLRLQKEKMEADNAKLKVKQHPLSAYKDLKFNPNSNPQKQKLLYEEMGLPVIDLTDAKQPACGGKTLEKLLNHTKDPEHIRIIEALLEFALADKILTTFIPAFEAAVDRGEHIVWLHGSFNLGGTKSGRLSSSDPNLQNIPSGSKYAKLIKRCFQAPDGWLFVGADFNSLEDYISALTTKDPNKLKVYIEGYDGHSLRAYSYWPEKFPSMAPDPESVNQIKTLHEAVRQASKAPTFALTYQGTYMTLMNRCGFSEEEAKRIEANYHELYKVSDAWVQSKLDEAAKIGYVKLAFGLRLKTPLLQQTIRGKRSTPYEAEAEGRTAGNALGQSYGLLTNRACNAFMRKVWASPYRNDIKPVAMIHDAIYLLIRNNFEVAKWVNENLIEQMQWQELPEIQHDTVKLGAELSVFWPTWEKEMVIPNKATIPEITALTHKHLEKLKEAA